MDTRITATELARSLSDVLNRVRYKGERFMVERNGEPVATIGPAGPKPGITLSEFLRLLKDLPQPDEDFARDVEAIRATQTKAMVPEWPS